MGMLDALTGLGKLATVVSGANPAVMAVTTGLEVISEICDGDDDKRTEMYMELAADFAELTGCIFRGLKDGKITEDEHKAIIAELKSLMPGQD